MTSAACPVSGQVGKFCFAIDRVGQEKSGRVGQSKISCRAPPGGEARRKAYRALFRFALDGEFLAALRAATNRGWALGDARFAQQIADAVGRRAAKLAAGRPNKDRRDERPQLKLL
jgi:hypothetical protein